MKKFLFFILLLDGFCAKIKFKDFMFAYQRCNIDKMLSYCDPDGEVYFKPLGDSGKGKIGELGRAIWASIIDCFPDIDNTVDATIAEDEDSVRCQVVMRGTQAKDFAGIVSKGKKFDSDHIFIFRLNEAGKLTESKSVGIMKISNASWALE
jgi:hypothetical protein